MYSTHVQRTNIISLLVLTRIPPPENSKLSDIQLTITSSSTESASTTTTWPTAATSSAWPAEAATTSTSAESTTSAAALATLSGKVPRPVTLVTHCTAHFPPSSFCKPRYNQQFRYSIHAPQLGAPTINVSDQDATTQTPPFVSKTCRQNGAHTQSMSSFAILIF